MTAYAGMLTGRIYGTKWVTGIHEGYCIFPPFFSKALRKYTGLKNTQVLFWWDFQFLRSEWEEQDRLNRPFTTVNYLSAPVSKGYSSYQYSADHRWIPCGCFKIIADNITELVFSVRGGGETLGYITNISGRPVHAGGKVYWTEYFSGFGGPHENNSVLRYYDFESGRIHTVTPAWRYIATGRPNLTGRWLLYPNRLLTEKTGSFLWMPYRVKGSGKRCVWKCFCKRVGFWW